MIQAGLLSYTSGRIRNTVGAPTIFGPGPTPLKNGLLALGGIGSFTRNFSNLSAANITPVFGTVSAASGNLAGTPTNGTGNERAYYDLCPALSGTLDITTTVDLTGSTNTSSIGLLFFCADDGTGVVPQNGYWVDINIQLNIIRLIRIVNSAAGEPPPSAHATAGVTTGVHAIRVTKDGSGNFNIYLDGVSKFTYTDTTFTSGARTGSFFFANPGPAPKVVDFTVQSSSLPGATPSYFNGPLPHDPNGSLITFDGGTPAYYASGMPFTSSGQLCVAINGTIAGYYAGLPMDSVGRLVLAPTE